MTTYIAYFRVSTEKQGQSGLGLEAQQEAVRRFLRPGDVVSATFIEVESGKNHGNRPQLAAAMDACRRHPGSKLLIAKLDRLARDVCFIANLMKSDIKFVAADMPEADPFRLHIEAAIAEEEARKISARTKAALAAAKARGIVLGGFRGFSPSDAMRAQASAVRACKARSRTLSLMPIVQSIQDSGFTTFNSIANELNKRGILTSNGGTWQANQVKRLLA